MFHLISQNRFGGALIMLLVITSFSMALLVLGINIGNKRLEKIATRVGIATVMLILIMMFLFGLSIFLSK
jgi:hypothetical protein